MSDFIDLRERFANQPALVSVTLADRICSYIRDGLPAEMQDGYREAAASAFDRAFGGDRPYRMDGNVAIIPITGSLYHRMGWGYTFATGYDYIVRLTQIAEADDQVAGIVYDINSGGGQVDGAFEAAEVIANVSKPTRAIINSHAYSAAYLLASAADERVVAQTGGAGSIGVVTMHLDASKAVKDAGYTVTFIHAGDRKVDGNRYMPLSPEVKARYQERIDSLYGLFVDTVAANTGLSVDAIVGTQADTFSAQESLELGLVDAIDSPSAALEAFKIELTGKHDRSFSMTTKKAESAEVPANQAETVALAAHEQAVADARAEGVAAGASQERERTLAVLGSDNFAGREAMALKLLESDMSAEQIDGVLATAPAATQAPAAADSGKTFQQAMDQGENPNVTAGMENSAEGGNQEVNATDRILGNYNMAKGVKAH